MESINNTPSTSTIMEAHSKSNLIEILPAAIYTCDKDGYITFYNRAAAELWGREPEIGKDMWCGSWKIYRPDGTLLPLDQCPMAVTLKEQRPVTGEEIVVERPDGGKFIILPHPQPIFDEAGNFTGAVNLLVDITDKKQEESARVESDDRYKSLSELLEKKVEERTMSLKKSEERYHRMIDEVQDYAILLLDSEGYILNWNKGAEKIKGYTEKEIIGKNFRIFYLDEDRATKLPESLIDIAYHKGRAMHEGWRLRKDGTQFWGSIVITALHDDEGNVIGFSKVTRDLTEKKLADDKLKNYAMDIEFRNKQLEEYAYIASHDLQEPLRKIQVFGEMLANNMDNKEAMKRNIDKINSSARRMTTLIKDVLKYSQLSRADELFQTTDLNVVMENIREDFDLLIEQKNVSLSTINLPVVQGIPIQLHQLFGNLVSNAIKFSTGDPIIEITAEEANNEEVNASANINKTKKYSKITVKDNGVGFDQQYGEHIFKMFKRLGDNSGTGIGLALCKKIVENHNGSINVTSETGRGTIFTILLPLD